MKIVSFLAALMLMVVSLVGCSGSGNKIAGTWIGKNVPNLPAGSEVKFVFGNPDSLSMKMTMEQPPVGKIGMEFVGTYKMSGDVMTINIKDVKIDTSGVKKEMADMVKQQLESTKGKMLEEINKDNQQTITWEGNDKFSVKSAKGQSATFTREK